MKRKTKLLSLIALLLMAVTQGAWAQDAIGGITYNAAGGYYEIDEVNDLSDLAVYVNGTGAYSDVITGAGTAHDCEGLKFKMTADITFTHSTAWDNAESTESNYTPIGGSGHLFKGDFDGAGHTISGIRIYRNSGSDNASDDNYQGIFGWTGNGANIHGLRLADARITGYQYIGGIVGHNQCGTITGCHVANDVCIHAVLPNAFWHGGIAGYNQTYFEGDAIIKNCTSAVTLTIADGATGCNNYGGIVGLNSGTLTGNLAVGATIPAAGSNYGAIAGNSSGGTLQNNFYAACTVAGTENATGVGCQNADVADNNGAYFLLAVTLGEGVSITSPEQPTATYDGTGYYCVGQTLTLGITSDAPGGYEYIYKVNDNTYGSNSYTVNLDDGNVTITLYPNEVIDWTTVNAGTAADPYMIYNKDQLNHLAYKVLQGDDYSGKYFRLANDITYPYTTAWNDATSTEDNYVPIGGSGHLFKGDFDGAGHTISGIRIYSEANASGEGYQGIFGWTGSGANIHGLRLADARITGYQYIGGIVGHNQCGTITGCHVANDVCIHAVLPNAFWHGGIAGYNQTYFEGDAIIKNCTSAATLTIADGATNCNYYGGIVGLNSGTLTGNLAVGATIPAAGSNYGAIAGNNSGGTLQNNLYTACTIAGVENATGQGCANADVATNDGAVPALRDQYDNTQAIALLASTTVDLGWGAGQYPVHLAGRTLQTGGWNTFCVPFNLDTPTGWTVKTLTASSFNSGTGELTLTFADAASIEAGKPYLVKVASNVANPTFEGVTISNSTTTTETTNADFVPVMNPTSLTGGDKTVLFVTGGNKLTYPTADGNINAFRAYFQLKGETASLARAFRMSFDDDATGIVTVLTDEPTTASGIYTLDGRRLQGQPAGKGMYIVNGKKIVVK